MIIDAGFLSEWKNKGHWYGECMSSPTSDLMYVYIPKNASSWTKPNLQDFGWEFYNYHTDNLNKTSIVALRDPIERWISGIAEYLYLYHKDFILHNFETFDLIFDRVCFDDHTEKQVNFIHNLDTERCIFLKADDTYRDTFSQLLNERGMSNKFNTYELQHVSNNSPERKRFKQIFSRELENSKYLSRIQDYYEEDYKLINSVTFYGTR